MDQNTPSAADQPARLADQLQQAGALDPAWRAAFLAVPRHAFIPDRCWVHRDNKFLQLDRQEDPDTWWEAVYQPNEVMITQFDDRGAPEGFHPTPTSSCPAPSVQMEMLRLLEVQEGMRVLEIGTGTGWNAALLTHRLGEEQVTSVEVDVNVYNQANRALEKAGYHPTIKFGDGSLGYPPGAPYDRIIATCAVNRIPQAWIAQTRPDGIILAPWAPQARFGNDLLTRLTVHPDGTATGQFVDKTAFMWLRQQRPPGDDHLPWLHEDRPAGAATSTALDPAEVLFRNAQAAFVTRLWLGEATCHTVGGRRDGSEGWVVWLADAPTGSWTRIRRPGGITDPLPPGTRLLVEQGGPRRLWDELEVVYRWWERVGEPDQQQFGLSVRPDAHTIWLADPAREVFRLPTPAASVFLDPAVNGGM